jgi:hypothetical protein
MEKVCKKLIKISHVVGAAVRAAARLCFLVRREWAVVVVNNETEVRSDSIAKKAGKILYEKTEYRQIFDKCKGA